MSGLRLLKADGKIVVYSVDEGSPAFLAGLKAEDEIISINGKLSSSLGLKQIRELLQEKDGKKMAIKASQRVTWL